MGTLFTQKPREAFSHRSQLKNKKLYLEDLVETIKHVVTKYDLTVEEATKIYELYLKEVRLAMCNEDFDVKDEQLAGFGNIFMDKNFQVTLTK